MDSESIEEAAKTLIRLRELSRLAKSAKILRQIRELTHLAARAKLKAIRAAPEIPPGGGNTARRHDSDGADAFAAIRRSRLRVIKGRG